MASDLETLIVRLETLGHEPADIVRQLSGQYDEEQVRVVVHEITGWSDRRLPVTRAKIAAARRGRSVSEETRKKMALAHTGMPVSKAARAKIAAAKRGTTHSDETRAKISAGNKGKRRSDAFRARLSAIRRAIEAAKRAERACTEMQAP